MKRIVQWILAVICLSAVLITASAAPPKLNEDSPIFTFLVHNKDTAFSVTAVYVTDYNQDSFVATCSQAESWLEDGFEVELFDADGKYYETELVESRSGISYFSCPGLKGRKAMRITDKGAGEVTLAGRFIDYEKAEVLPLKTRRMDVDCWKEDKGVLYRKEDFREDLRFVGGPVVDHKNGRVIGIFNMTYDQEPAIYLLKEIGLPGTMVRGRDVVPMKDGKYAGDVLDGLPDGRGVYTLDIGCSFTGEFKNGDPDGQGTFRFVDGTTKSGGFGWVRYWGGQFLPQYRLTETSYSGMVSGGKPCGYGTMEFLGYGYYVGEFKDGFPCGTGTYYYHTYNNKPSITGSNWSVMPWGRLNEGLDGAGLLLNGCMQGYGVSASRQYGDYYIGEVEYGLRSGWGSFYGADGTLKQQGRFVNGEYAGRGY